jgi:hypothetical protein
MRRVEDAVPVTEKLVVVAFVPVPFTKVKFWSVDEPVARRFANDARPVDESVLNDAFPETLKFVVVALVAVAFPVMMRSLPKVAMPRVILVALTVLLKPSTDRQFQSHQLPLLG